MTHPQTEHPKGADRQSVSDSTAPSAEGSASSASTGRSGPEPQVSTDLTTQPITGLGEDVRNSTSSGELRQAGDEGQFNEVPVESKEPPTADFGLNPFGWSQRLSSFFEERAVFIFAHRSIAMEDILKALGQAERKQVLGAIDGAFRTTQNATFRFTLVGRAIAIFTTAVTVLALFAPLIVVLSLGGNFVAGLVAIVLFSAWTSLSYRVVQRPLLRSTIRSGRRRLELQEFQLFNLGAVAAVTLFLALPMALLVIAPRVKATPPWLIHGGVHESLLGAASVLLVMAIVILITNVTLRLYWSWVQRRIHRRASEQLLIDRTASLILNLFLSEEKASNGETFVNTPRQSTEYADLIERIASEFEEHWPRQIKSRHPRVRATAHRWARQVSAAMRREQLPLILGQRRPADLRMSLSRFIVSFILREPLEEASQSEDHQFQRRAFWRKIGRPILAVILLITMVVLVLMAVWQPGLPKLLESWNFPTLLTNISSVPRELRPGVLGAAVAAFTVLVKVAAPEKAPSK